MQKLTGDPTKKEYWDSRVKKIPDKKDMLFLDGRREEFWERARQTLLQWHNLEVLDVCCGYGQFAPVFEPGNYTGVDFSEEMIRLANQELDLYNFVLLNAKDFTPAQEYDVVFEVNSLRSLGWTAEEFINYYKPFAKRAVISLEADQFIIHQIYGTDKR